MRFDVKTSDGQTKHFEPNQDAHYRVIEGGALQVDYTLPAGNQATLTYSPSAWIFVDEVDET